MLKVSHEEITSAPIPRVLVLLAAPLVLQNFIHVANAIVDTFWLGRLGENEVAAVGLNFPIISIVAAGIVLVAVGVQIALAQRVGADEIGQAKRLAVTGLILATIVGIIVCGAFFLAAEPLMAMLANDPSVAPLAALYLATLMLFYPFAFMSDTVENAFVGWGDTTAALYINLVMVGTNIVLDPFLIFGWGPFPALGVQGAALASGIGFVFAFVLGLAFAFGLRDSFTIDRPSLRVDLSMAREVIDIGSPLCGQRVVRDIVRVFIIGLVALAGGAAAVAAFTVGARVAAVAFVPAIGLQQAAQAMIGQNLGADRPDRAFETTTVGVAIAAVGLGLIGVVQWFVPGLIVDVLVPDLTETGRELSIIYLQILAISYWALGASYLFLAGFNGARRTRTSFVVDLLKYWGVRFPIAVLAIPTTVTFAIFGISITPGVGWGVEAIFWAVTISNIVAAVGVGIYFFHTTRRGMFQRASDRALAATADE